MELTHAMQVRCVHCLREQYCLAVIGVSAGTHPCVWCGEKSQPMTVAEYRKALSAKQREAVG